MLASRRVEVLLLDLDDTLYAPESGVLHRVDARINAYLCDVLGVPPDRVDAVRSGLREAHGTTLRGLERTHSVDPDHYLRFVHDCDLSDLLAPDPELRALLLRLPPRKVVFTNAPRSHAVQVLGLLGVADAFERVVSLEDFRYLPKPDPAAYATVLRQAGVGPEACCFVDDTRSNLLPARMLGMRTVWKAPHAAIDEHVHHAIAELVELEPLWR